MILDDFISWKDKIVPELEQISSILSEQLSDEPEVLIHALKEAETWNGRALALLAQANGWLDLAKHQLMPPKEEGKSEADRKAEIDALVSPVRLIRDTLEGYVDSIKQRLILGESCLSYAKMYKEPIVMKSPY